MQQAANTPKLRDIFTAWAVNMQAFLVSVVAGWLFPALPIIAEYGLTNDVLPETWSLTGIVYTTAVGLASRNQAIAISSFFFSTTCAVIYAAQKLQDAAHADTPFIRMGSQISIGTLYFFAMCYLVERFGRHWIDDESFLEFQ